MRHDYTIEVCPGSPVRVGDHRPALTAFTFLRDRLFLASCGLYLLNRFLVRPNTTIVFFHDHFNDLLLIPCALPVVLWLQRVLGLRHSLQQPTALEVLFHLGVWSIVSEWLGPHLFSWARGDLLDVLAYTSGAAIAWLWWNRALLLETEGPTR